MNDIFASLAARVRLREPAIRPNLGSAYEPPEPGDAPPEAPTLEREFGPALAAYDGETSSDSQSPPRPCRLPPRSQIEPAPEATRQSPESERTRDADSAPKNYKRELVPTKERVQVDSLPARSQAELPPRVPVLVEERPETSTFAPPSDPMTGATSSLQQPAPIRAPGEMNSDEPASEAAESPAIEPTMAPPVRLLRGAESGRPSLAPPDVAFSAPHNGRQGHFANEGPFPRRHEAAEPVVHVTIGRLEIRATVSPPPKSIERLPSPAPHLSLEEYLRRSSGGGR